MGYGDEVMATGQARGLSLRGKRAAFGDGQRIIWGPWSSTVFQNNPNIARPGSEKDSDLVWIPNYKGSRPYNHPGGRGWIWHMNFRPSIGEFFFSPHEDHLTYHLPPGSVVIEPNVPKKPVAPNKQWPVERYQAVADILLEAGWSVFQLVSSHSRVRLPRVKHLPTETYRRAVSTLRSAALYIGPEGGMHHAAAAVGTAAVVIFGGFIPTTVTGYAGHVNLGGKPEDACGSTSVCEHCRKALLSISVDEVIQAAQVARPAVHAGGYIYGTTQAQTESRQGQQAVAS